MPRRPALVTQADVNRAIRAARQAGLVITRIVARPDGVSIETAESVSSIVPFPSQAPAPTPAAVEPADDFVM
jgi:hypothetical protein